MKFAIKSADGRLIAGGFTTMEEARRSRAARLPTAAKIVSLIERTVLVWDEDSQNYVVPDHWPGDE